MVTHDALTAACGEAVRCFKGYQLVGVNFLTLLARSGVGGAIMADEMGLGKTAQAIAFLGAYLTASNHAPHFLFALNPCKTFCEGHFRAEALHYPLSALARRPDSLCKC